MFPHGVDNFLVFSLNENSPFYCDIRITTVEFHSTSIDDNPLLRYSNHNGWNHNWWCFFRRRSSRNWWVWYTIVNVFPFSAIFESHRNDFAHNCVRWLSVSNQYSIGNGISTLIDDFPSCSNVRIATDDYRTQSMTIFRPIETNVWLAKGTAYNDWRLSVFRRCSNRNGWLSHTITDDFRFLRSSNRSGFAHKEMTFSFKFSIAKIYSQRVYRIFRSTRFDGFQKYRIFVRRRCTDEFHFDS